MTTSTTRRAFLRQAARIGALGAAAPLGLNLSAMASAAASNSSVNDYKAIVCLFMFGGNDHYNTIVPYDASGHADYAGRRPDLAIARLALTASRLNPAPGFNLPNGRQFALEPSMNALVPLFNTGKLAVTLNVGTLIDPVTKEQVLNGSARLPPKLMSHNDQQSFWQSSLAEGATSGWGGRMADLFASEPPSVFTAVSAANSRALFVSGDRTAGYSVTPTGAVPNSTVLQPVFGSPAAANLIRSLITEPRSHPFEELYNSVNRRSLDAEALLSAALLAAPPLNTPFDDSNPLAQQLRMVARMIQVRTALGSSSPSPIRRQVFLVGMGGFDTHDEQPNVLPGLLGRVAQGMASFFAAMTELGVDRQVTLFTASDFGRTLVSNGDGTDHGWGTHQFIMGGGIKGRRFFGTPPSLVAGSSDDWNNGRLIPTTAADQVSRELARWFGVSDSDMNIVLPNARNFANLSIF
jgi:uncharacterized protein (DUF1501 family)